MPDKPLSSTVRRPNRPGMGSLLLLLAAAGGWLWLLANTLPTPMGVAIVFFAPVAVGTIGHVVHRRVVASRLTVLACCLLVGAGPAVAFGYPHLLAGPFLGVGNLDGHSEWIRWSLFFLLPACVSLPANIVRPNVLTAQTTAIGVAFWFFVAQLYVAAANLGAG